MRRAAIILCAMVLAGPPARAETCFDRHLPPAAPGWMAEAARAAVRLVGVLPDGRGFASASGIVVAGSGTPNRMLTAAHVLRAVQQQRGAWLAVFASTGVYLGRASLAARATPGPAFGLVRGGQAAGLRFGDAAVIDIAAFAPGGAAAYAAIAGVRLAPIQPRGLLEGVFATPAGVDHGVSGAGVVVDGGIVGVMAFKQVDTAMPTVATAGGDAARPPRERAVALPRQSVGFAQPATDAGLLAALGPAGRTVGRQRGTGMLRVFVPGYIGGACFGFTARMRPA